MNPKSAAIVGFLFSLPFIIANFIVSLRIEPFYSFLEIFPDVRNSTVLPLLLTCLFPIGAFVAIKPMLKTSNGKRKFYLLNTILALIMISLFIFVFFPLLEDTYRCDVLKIPNCD